MSEPDWRQQQENEEEQQQVLEHIHSIYLLRCMYQEPYKAYENTLHVADAAGVGKEFRHKFNWI